MLFSATLLALILGTAVSSPSPWYQGSRHPTRLNPFWRDRSSLTQGFLCDSCVVGVGDVQDAIRENLDEINILLNRTSQLCEYCPVKDQCYDYFENEVPAFLNEFLAETPNDICTLAGLCDDNATVLGMVINNLRSDIARDRVISRMLMRARIMQQKMIRLILGSDYLCTTCQDIVMTAKEILLDKETQHEVVELLSPLCDYFPAEYQPDCILFVNTIPELMTHIANDILVDSTCSELGFCNTKEIPEVTDTIDVLSQLGLPGVLPVRLNSLSRARPSSFQGQNPRGQYRQNLPFQFPGQSESRPQQFPAPKRKWPTSTNSRIPQIPKSPVQDENIRDINLDDIFSQTKEILDMVPPPPIRIPSSIPFPNLPPPKSIPGAKGRGKNKRNRGQQGRRVRSLVDWRDTETMVGTMEDITHEYLPDPIPEGGIIITEQGADENCEMCKVAVAAIDAWLQENAPRIQTQISKLVKPFCKMFPSPMKEDCVSDATDFVATIIEKLVSHLQPEPVCKWVGVCSTQQKDPIVPTIKAVVEPTWIPRFP